jgi:hypothetical protein
MDSPRLHDRNVSPQEAIRIQQQAAAPELGNGRGRMSFPDLEYSAASPVGDPEPVPASR